MGVPDQWAGNGVAGTNAGELSLWWRRLNDPLLDALIADAIVGNLDLSQSRARLLQARESLVQARSARYPALSAGAGAQRTFDSDGDDFTTLTLGGDASWTVDLFGGIARSVEAARADTQSVGYDLDAVRVAIVGEVASNYVQARLAQRRLATAQDTLAFADDNLEIAGFRVQAGLVSSLDVEQARAERAQNAAAIPAIERDYAGSVYRLSVLSGRAPGALVASLAPPRPIPVGPADVAVGVPADTLRQRPDVRAAERALAAATARIGVAEAALRPGLGLTGDVGLSALSLGSLLDRVTGSLFAGLTQPLFNGGRLRSQVRFQEAAVIGAIADYRQSVLDALEDVENGLAALAASRRRRVEFDTALRAADASALLSRTLYRSGLTDFRTLLESERSLVSAREGVDSAQGEQALAVVQLYVALGGGWNDGGPSASLAGIDVNDARP